MIEIETLFLTTLQPDMLATLAQSLPGVHVLAKLTEPFEKRIQGRLWCFVDWVLPDCSGLEMCRRLREAVPASQGHITMVLEDDDTEARRRALRAGADDYLVGPLTPELLVSRLQQYYRPANGAANDCVIRVEDADPETDGDCSDRRTFGASTAAQWPPEMADDSVSGDMAGRAPQVVGHGDLALDLAGCQAYWRGEPIRLRPNEFRLLAHFVENAGKVLSRTSLIARIGKEGMETDERTVDVWVGRLRRALKVHGVPDVLRTVRSFGYVLDRIA